MEYWRGDIENKWDVEKIRMHDTGHGILVKDKTEPIYGTRAHRSIRTTSPASQSHCVS